MILQIRRPSAQLPLLSRNIRKVWSGLNIRFDDVTFYRQHPSSSISDPTTNPPLFKNLTLTISNPSTPTKQCWAIIGRPSTGKTTLLKTIGGANIAIPPTGRKYSFIESQRKTPEGAIKRVGFDGEGENGGGRGAYLSARYESRREGDDWTVEAYLRGRTEMNPLEDSLTKIDDQLFLLVTGEMRLQSLLGLSVADLSNGQNRRMRIAKAMLETPELLLLDEPFAGLDPGSVRAFEEVFGKMAERGNPRLILALNVLDRVPEWVTDIIYLKENCRVEFCGRKEKLFEMHPELSGVRYGKEVESGGIVDRNSVVDGYKSFDTEKVFRFESEPLVEMDGAIISYGSKAVLGNWTQDIDGKTCKGLFWKLRRGDRWGVFGPNGSGKTTLLSLICSDHPQTYSLPIKIFGRERTASPGNPGLSIFEIQARIGHSSPEIHNHIPKSLTIRQVLESAWADTFRSAPNLDADADLRIDAFLMWFKADLAPKSLAIKDIDSLIWPTQNLFGGLSLGAQKLVLFLRAIIKSPDIVILDEAFSNMDDMLRNKCLLFLSHGLKVRERDDVVFGGLKESQALVVISHVKEEVPECVREWICLPDPEVGGSPRVGRLEGPIAREGRWEKIWGISEEE